MIVFFGPAGVGKSMQGQILAERHGWNWLSAGQLLRDKIKDPDFAKSFKEIMNAGNLLPPEVVSDIILEAADRAHKTGTSVILDGYPRSLNQAKYLTEHTQKQASERRVQLAIVMSVPATEIYERLALRGRKDDAPEVVAHRLEIYRQKTQPLLDYYREQGVPVVKVNGVGTVEQVHDRIEAVLAQYKLN